MTADYTFYELFKKLLDKNERDTELLRFQENQSKNSVYFASYKICHFRKIKGSDYVCLPESVVPLLEELWLYFDRSSAKSDTFPIMINIMDMEIINYYAEFWVLLYDEIYIKNAGDTYSFCSRWKECSNALACTNPNKSDARLCKYKRNIEKGLIFEGDYAVFDENGAVDDSKVRRNLSLMKRSVILNIDIPHEERVPITQLRGESIEEPLNTYVVLDIETTGIGYKNDILEFAAIKVKNNQVVDTLSFLISTENQIPYYISELTGITNDMLSEARPFSEHINEILSFIGDDIIVGHNIIFDIDRLNNKIYELTNKSIGNYYSDTMRLAKERICDIENYKLGSIAKYLNIDVENAHRSLDDCYTTWKCYQKLIELPCADYDDLYMSRKLRKPQAKKSKYLQSKDIQATTDEFDENHALFNKTIVITGYLETMTRAEAYQRIKNVGGLCGDSVTMKTDYLVTNSIAMTGKMKKAIEYKEKGSDIEIINEEQLIQLLN